MENMEERQLNSDKIWTLWKKITYIHLHHHGRRDLCHHLRRRHNIVDVPPKIR